MAAPEVSSTQVSGRKARPRRFLAVTFAVCQPGGASADISRQIIPVDARYRVYIPLPVAVTGTSNDVKVSARVLRGYPLEPWKPTKPQSVILGTWLGPAILMQRAYQVGTSPEPCALCWETIEMYGHCRARGWRSTSDRAARIPPPPRAAGGSRAQLHSHGLAAPRRCCQPRRPPKRNQQQLSAYQCPHASVYRAIDFGWKPRSGVRCSGGAAAAAGEGHGGGGEGGAQIREPAVDPRPAPHLTVHALAGTVLWIRKTLHPGFVSRRSMRPWGFRMEVSPTPVALLR